MMLQLRKRIEFPVADFGRAKVTPQQDWCIYIPDATRLLTVLLLLLVHFLRHFGRYGINVLVNEAVLKHIVVEVKVDIVINCMIFELKTTNETERFRSLITLQLVIS